MKNELFGLRGKINTNKFFFFNINLNRDDIRQETLNYYIRRGDYVSEIAFSIIKRNEKFLILTNEASIKKVNQKIKINHYIGMIGSKSKDNIILSNEEISTYLYSLVDSIFSKRDYQKPNEIRSFLGKRSKGKIANRTKEILRKKVPEWVYDKEIQIFESINKKVLVYNNTFYLFILPNFEFVGEKTKFALNKIVIDLMLKQEDVKDIIFFNPNDFAQKVNEYNEFLLSDIGSLSFIKNIEKIQTIPSNFLAKDFQFSSQFLSLNNSFKLIENESFSDQAFNFFKKNLSNLERINIILYVDNLSDEIPDYIKNYIKELHNISFFKIIEEVCFKSISDLKKPIDNESLYVIVDDNLPGNTYIHTKIKEISSQSKMINYTTIKEMKKDENHFLIMWLSLISRKNCKFPIQFVNKTFDYHQIYCINFTQNLMFNYVLMVITRLDLKTLEFNSRKKTFFINKNKFINRKKLICAILEEVQEEFHNIEDSLIFIDGKGIYSDIIFAFFNQSQNVVLISKSECRILENDDQGDYKRPEDGLFYKFNKSNDFLLVSTGKPDHNNEGIPNPILVKMSNYIKEPEKVLEIIYALTFLQTKMLGKNLLPSIISINNSMLWGEL